MKRIFFTNRTCLFFSNPTPLQTALLPKTWFPMNVKDPQVFVIDEEFSTNSIWEDEAMQMWKDIYSKYRSKMYYE